MTQTLDIKSIRKLSLEQRLSLIEKIWDSIEAEKVPFTDKQWTEIQRRLKHYREHPESAMSYEQFEEVIRSLT